MTAPRIRGLKYATPRTPTRPSYGEAVGKLAAMCGTPFSPWQQYVVDVMLEVMPDGEWAYTDIVLTVQRQQGKTTIDGPLGVHRCLIRPFSSSWVTAQTRQDARDNFVDGFFPRFRTSPFIKLAKSRLSQGSERLTFPDTGSLFGVFSPGEEALHGKQPAPQLVINDEHWAFSLEEGRAMGAAIGPTFTTSGGQWLRHSTAGTAASEWLREDVTAGRLAVERQNEDPRAREGTAYFEFGFPDDRRDEVLELLEHEPDDPAFDAGLELLMSYMPTRGFRKADGTLLLKERVVRTEARKMRDREAVGDILRGYGNLWTETAENVIPAGPWQAARRDRLPQPGVPVGLAFACARDRSDAAIVAAWRDPDDARMRWAVIDHRPGTSWLEDRVADLIDTRDPALVMYDRHGPATDIGDALERRGYELQHILPAEMAAACIGTLAAIVDAGIIYQAHDELNDIHLRAAKKDLGNRWVWNLKDSAGSIVCLDAGTIAGWAFDHAPVAPEKPSIRFRE